MKAKEIKEMTNDELVAKLSSLKEELFKYGISMDENELIENFTGKKLSVEDFIKSLKN